MKIYAIGDVHGCLEELKQLMKKIDVWATPNDKIVFLGDYVDRGPDSKGVIDFLIDHEKASDVPHIFLRGNHEVMMMTKADYWVFNGGEETLKSYGISMPDWPNYLKLIPKEHIDFINKTQYYYKVGKTVFVHAGLDPELSLEEQDPNVLLWTRTYVNSNVKYHDDVKVVFGHTPQYEVIERENHIGIDTACVFGNKLTCAIIDPEYGDVIDFISVKSNYDWKG